MFSGSLVAIVTPMSADGAVDFAAWDRLLSWHLEQGTSGIVVGGTTGESATLADTELVELARRACECVDGRAAVLVGAGSSSTAGTVERVGRLCALPIDGLLLVTPAYNRPTQDGLYQHFAAAAAAAAGKAVVLYNVPSRTAVDLLPPTAARLSRLPGIVGLKEAVPQAARVRELIAACAPGFAILSGDDATAREAIIAGARGVISVTANVVPAAMSKMVAAALRGDPQAAQLDEPLRGLHRDLFLEANPIPVKWLLEQMGRIGPGVRLPLTRLSAVHHEAVRAAARAAGVGGLRGISTEMARGVY
ncbi:MAG: 4-hydroxy-tetrahydrodipicolinate synthase [Proteobacteria bacterium]|nr:4-hydroxy-tetrahydrodipicolinate synthase [Pseudomonadota bacterium]